MSHAIEVYVGIDVACSKSKRLPICFVRKNEPHGLEVLEIPPDLRNQIPRGSGNIAISEKEPFVSLAREAASTIAAIALRQGWKIQRVSIDAPAGPSKADSRGSEKALLARGVSSFLTPTIVKWEEIKRVCKTHLLEGGAISRIPYANKIWMLYGFELFKALGENDIETIETYPQAVIAGLDARCPHKSTPEGYRRQLSLVSQQTGWADFQLLERQLKLHATGGKTDRLDAYISAWVASLEADKRFAFGDQSNAHDSIWVPLNCYQ